MSIGLLVICIVLALIAVIFELLLLRWLFQRVAIKIAVVIGMSLAGVPVMLFCLSARYFAQEPELVSPYAGYAGAVLAGLVLLICHLAVRKCFNKVIRAEEANALPSVLAAVKRSAYVAITAMYAGVLLSCVASLIGVTGKWKAGQSIDFHSLVIPASVLVSLMIINTVANVIGARTAQLIGVTSCLTWVGFMTPSLAAGFGDWKQVVLTVVAALFAALFVFEGVLSNLGSLQNAPVGWPLAVAALASSLAAGSTVAWVTGPAIWHGPWITSIPVALTSMLIGATAGVVMPHFAVQSLPGTRPSPKYTLNTPLGGVRQDCYMMTLIYTSVAWLPNLAMAHVNDAAAWMNCSLPFLALLSAAYVWIMENNTGHGHRERVRVTNLAAQAGTTLSAEEDRALDALARHIQRQNRLALIPLIPLGILVVVTEFSGFRSGWRKILKV